MTTNPKESEECTQCSTVNAMFIPCAIHDSNSTFYGPTPVTLPPDLEEEFNTALLSLFFTDIAEKQASGLVKEFIDKVYEEAYSHDYSAGCKASEEAIPKIPKKEGFGGNILRPDDSSMHQDMGFNRCRNAAISNIRALRGIE